MAGGVEKGGAKIGGLAPVAARDDFAQPQAIDFLRRAENAFDLLAATPHERVEAFVFVKSRDGVSCVVKKRDQPGKHIAKKPGDVQADVDARELALCKRFDFEAADARRRRVPQWNDAEKRQRLRKIFAAGADRRAAPKIEHDLARVLAMLLRVPRHHLFRGAPTQVIGALRGRVARIDAIEIAARGQNVAASARGRARRSRLNEAAFERA